MKPRVYKNRESWAIGDWCCELPDGLKVYCRDWQLALSVALHGWQEALK